MRRATLAAALAGVTALTACTADSPSAGSPSAGTATLPPPSLSPAAIGADPVILVHDNRSGSQLMPLTARLRWAGSCLVVVTADHRPERTAIPVWPKDTAPLRAPDGRRGVTVPTGAQFLDGDALSGGGSWIRPDSPAYPRFTPPGGCRGYDTFFVLDSTDLRRG
ncbi:hypothetical protein [Nonomuraea typhae]|uniref:Lipoprotein n=1 Tax=Nonomuraea typhae TaxID=2603600 RepID=A0ABW7Z7R9_9ACTN